VLGLHRFASQIPNGISFDCPWIVQGWITQFGCSSFEAIMSLRILCFGPIRIDFQAADGCTIPVPIDALKARELLGFLVLHSNRNLLRESVAAALWGDVSTDKSLKHLRQALWQLQSGFESVGLENVFSLEGERIGFHANADVWSDVIALEAACQSLHGVAGVNLDPAQAASLMAMEQLYVADTLEGWNQEWCLLERERLQNLYLVLLEKLMDHCEIQGCFEAGLQYGSRLLGFDRARECTHQRLMRLHYRAGNRTAALRQFELCQEVLKAELDVRPARRTLVLHEAIRNDLELEDQAPKELDSGSVGDLLKSLQQMQLMLTDLQQRVQQLHSVQT
jgi:DNA-binding SARP family transcriptional activator